MMTQASQLHHDNQSGSAHRSSSGWATALLLSALAVSPASWGSEASGPELDSVPAKGGNLPGNLDPFSEEEQSFSFALGLQGRKLFQEAAAEYDNFLSKYPKSSHAPAALLNLGEIFFTLEDYPKALPYFEQFLQKYPADAQAMRARLRLGGCLYQLNRHQDALKALAPLLAGKPDPAVSTLAHYYSGRACQELGQLEQASKELSAALNDPEVGALSRYALGELELRQNHPAEAGIHFGIFCKNYPSHNMAGMAALRLAETFQAQGKHQDAINQYQALLSGKPEAETQLKAKLGIGWAKFSLGDFVEAEKCGREVAQVESPLKDSGKYLTGSALLRQEKFGPAGEELAAVTNAEFAGKAMLQRVWTLLGEKKDADAANLAAAYLKDHPKEEAGAAHYLLGLAASRSNNAALAADHLRQARDDAACPYREDAAFLLATTLAALNNAKDALAAHDFCIANFPKGKRLASAHLGRGDVLYANKDFASAASAYASVIKSDGCAAQQKEYSLARQAACYFELKDFDKADACYRAILAELPQSQSAPEALYWVSWRAQELRRFDEAIAGYARLLKDYPQHARAESSRYRMGMCQYLSGKEDAAGATFFEILDKHPETPLRQEEMLWLGSHFVKLQDSAKADAVFDRILSGKADESVRAMALFRQAELKRSRREWEPAIEKYSQLAQAKDDSFKSLAYFGLGVCQRETGKLDDAAQSLAKVRFRQEDSMNAGLLLELGLLAKAQGKADDALRHLMRLGLLYDDKDLCGQAMLEAAKLYLAKNEKAKAISCLDELGGNAPGTYGEKYGKDSAWSTAARQLKDEATKAGQGQNSK